jgi:hypothetical protein
VGRRPRPSTFQFVQALGRPTTQEMEVELYHTQERLKLSLSPAPVVLRRTLHSGIPEGTPACTVNTQRSLGTANNYAILAGAITTVPASVITGDIVCSGLRRRRAGSGRLVRRSLMDRPSQRATWNHCGGFDHRGQHMETAYTGAAGRPETTEFEARFHGASSTTLH